MKKFIKILVCILLPFSSIAQQDLYVEGWSDTQADSLLIEFNKQENDTLRMQLARSLGWYYQEINRDSSLYFHEQQLSLARKLQMKLWEADALDQAGWVLSQLKNYSRSLQYFLDAIRIVENPESGKNIWKISIFSNTKDPENARLTVLGYIYNDQSQLFKSTGNTNKEIASLMEGIKIGKEVGNYTLLSLTTLNLSESYLKIGKLDSAFFYINEALAHIDISGFQRYRGNALTILGNIYLKNKEIEKAKKSFAESVEANLEVNNKTALPYSYYLMGEIFNVTGESDSSIFYTKKALTGFQLLGNQSGINDAYASLYSSYSTQKNIDSAFYYLQLSKTLSDSINKAEKDKINDYQNLGFNDQIKLQELEKEQIQKENRIRTYVFITGSLILFFIGLILFRNNRQKQKANAVLEITLSNLKSTQAQLIQSEKMASLGELTAGIAHEIQNPLNFVNNFSEVSNELIDEMNEEIEKGDFEEVKVISGDLKENLSKINVHGKRADAIVKGMLEHSRANKGEKTLTDLNALADEYVRLSYHGLRAKDKSFNADFKLELDPDLPKVNVVASDIGRVILNLVNNGFYAVGEKAKSTPQLLEKEEGYKPEVVISSMKTEKGIELSVKDNGNGIPDHIKEKIFQPFFTTKPAGSGTGLGLSLSYDIVKAHGGELRVESKENEGTEFRIVLPL